MENSVKMVEGQPVNTTMEIVFIRQEAVTAVMEWKKDAIRLCKKYLSELSAEDREKYANTDQCCGKTFLGHNVNWFFEGSIYSLGDIFHDLCDMKKLHDTLATSRK